MTWIQTYTGRRFDLFHPDPEQVDIRDIAHALGRICRWTGHTLNAYSVAEHSVRVALLVEAWDPTAAYAALMHDAHEAYVGDVSSPMKQAMRRQAKVGPCSFDRIEDRVVQAVRHALAISPTREQCELVKRADLVLLMIEAHEVYARKRDDWDKVDVSAEVMEESLRVVGPAQWLNGPEATMAFAGAHHRLTGIDWSWNEP